MSNFKAGDLVYSPTEGTDVLEVIATDDLMYPIEVGDKSFTECGMYHNTDHHPSIFHATKENQALLEALYGVKFDDPPLSDADRVIKALEKANGKPVLCLVKSVNWSGWVIQAIDSYSEQRGFKVAGKLPVFKAYDEVKPLSPDEFVLA